MVKRKKTSREIIEETAAQMWRRSAFRTLCWWLGAIAAGLVAAWLLSFTVGCTTPARLTPQEIVASCPSPVFENRTDEKRTANDNDAMATAKTQCSHYYPYSPCLITFTKVGFQNYHAICGAKR
jgi:hypothetical protein